MYAAIYTFTKHICYASAKYNIEPLGHSQLFLDFTRQRRI